jgi:hypothetical protein
MTISSPLVLGALKGLLFVVVMAVLGWLGDVSHLQGLFNPVVDSLISMVALAIENSLAAKSGSTAMFGAIKTQ